MGMQSRLLRFFRGWLAAWSSTIAVWLAWLTSCSCVQPSLPQRHSVKNKIKVLLPAEAKLKEASMLRTLHSM